MKFTKLSLIAALAVSSAYAGGDIVPVEPVVVAPVAEACNSNTTINGKLQGYYYTDDSVDLFDNESSALGTAATLDVSHKLMDGIVMNFGAVGYTNLISENYMEGQRTGAFMNVANITATFADTTLVAGRQLLDTPMLGGFDWLLAPGAFEAYTLVNQSISNLTLVGSYVRTWRPNNSGNDFINLTDIGDGNNWTLGASYSDAFSASIWYYNVDAGDYGQVYADAGYDFGSAKVAGQYIYTDYNVGDESTAFGLKASASLAGFDLMAAYANVADNVTGYVGRDTIYTSSWNTFTSNSIGNAFKVEAATEFSGLSAAASYGYYEYDTPFTEDGHEFDVILGYGITNCISLDAIYSNTDYGDGVDINALEFIVTYKF